ncbi:C40 family peptidase [Jatrophihabitans cynanchi]|uniref:C40 family peptidase n=1 Tax=Jatrophihabitans cynanchi TaxID=2944128 RepID=A0ABY7JRD8_9ACTN|nr:C40 family peptidase [Jatrophihabitans sp. SB3-54]WAX55122.1 C40 family peptidase [Jatrophihabitans sp. SB3-54]
MKPAVIGGIAAALIGALVLFLVVIGGSASGGLVTSALAVTPTCAGRGPISGLNPTQAANAHTVIAVAEGVGGRQAAVIAVSVALAESDLRDLGNTSVPGSDIGQGMGSDHDSVGLFQQRASWGSVSDRLDPTTATRLFVSRLLAVAGWRQMPPWLAAQAVQDSAHTDGSNYEATLALARQILAGAGGGTSCDTLTGGAAANTRPGSHGLPDDYIIPATANAAETAVITFAIAQLDKPYVFGAAGPRAYDCSGLTMTAWAQVGVGLPHYTVAQARAGTPVASPARMSPGDLILVPGDDGTVAAPGHVGLYLGDGLVINAADPADGIRVQTYTNFVQVGHGLSGIRHIG